jgi:hypothetical protein
VLSLIVRLLRLASLVICLIVIASFAIFTLNQTKSASGHQQEQISHDSATAGSSSPRPSGASSTHESTAHKAIDEASSELTSPFAGIVSGSSSQWTIRGVELLLALAVYGFGLGYLARALRIRV